MSISLLTGFYGEPHVTSMQDGGFNAVLYGSGRYVFDIGDRFAGEVLSRTMIRISDGFGMTQGRKFATLRGDHTDLDIGIGTAGYFRKDLVVARYQRDLDTDKENVTLAVIQGVPNQQEEDCVLPDPVQGNIFEEASMDDVPLYEVDIQDLDIIDLKPLFEPITLNLADQIVDILSKFKTLEELVSNKLSAQDAENTYFKKSGGDLEGKLGFTSAGNEIDFTQGAGKIEELAAINATSKTKATFGGDVEATKFIGEASRSVADSAGNNLIDTYATKNELGTQVEYSLTGTTLTITTK